MRERLFSHERAITPVANTYHDTSVPSGITTYSQIGKLRYDIYHDVVTSNFEEKKTQGNLVFNPMGRFSDTYTQDAAVLTAMSGTRGGVPVSGGYAFVNPLSVPDYSYDAVTYQDIFTYFINTRTSDRNIAISEAFAAIDQSELLAAASLGEMPETMAYLATCFRRLVKLFRLFFKKKTALRLKRRKGGNKAPLLLEESQLWLEFRYAIRPLVFEVSSAIKALNKSLALRERFTARGYHDTVDYSDSLQSQVVLQGGWCTLKWRRTDRVTYTARAGALYEILLEDERDLSVILGLDRPFSSAWELVPFSFILDWFFTVGDLIASWEVNPALVVQGAWVTEELVRTQVCALESVHLDSSWSYSPYADMDASVASAGTAKLVSHWRHRDVSVTRPVFPSIRINLNGAKIIDLLAILRGLVRSLAKL